MANLGAMTHSATYMSADTIVSAIQTIIDFASSRTAGLPTTAVLLITKTVTRFPWSECPASLAPSSTTTPSVVSTSTVADPLEGRELSVATDTSNQGTGLIDGDS
jgi:hypothetical protein